MLKIGGTAAASTNVLNGTKMQTIYAAARMVIRAVASAAAPTTPSVTADFSSGEKVLMTNGWVRSQDQGVAEEIGPGPDNVIYDGMVPPGPLILEFSATCYWEATLY